MNLTKTNYPLYFMWALFAGIAEVIRVHLNQFDNWQSMI